MFDVHKDPFYRPLWRRIAIVAVAAGWSMFEIFYVGSGFWTILALGILAYSIWSFLLTYPKA